MRGRGWAKGDASRGRSGRGGVVRDCGAPEAPAVRRPATPPRSRSVSGGEGAGPLALAGTKRRRDESSAASVGDDSSAEGRDEHYGGGAGGWWTEPPEVVVLPATYRRVFGVGVNEAPEVVMHQVEGAKTLIVMENRLYVDLDQKSKYLTTTEVHHVDLGKEISIFLTPPRAEWNFDKKRGKPPTIPDELKDPLCRRVFGFHKNETHEAIADHFVKSNIPIERERVHNKNHHLYVRFPSQQQADSAKETIHSSGRTIFAVNPEAEFKLPFASPKYIHKQPQKKVPRTTGTVRITEQQKDLSLIKANEKNLTAKKLELSRQIEAATEVLSNEEVNTKNWLQETGKKLEIEEKRNHSGIRDLQASLRSLEEIASSARSRDILLKQVRDQIKVLLEGTGAEDPSTKQLEEDDPRAHHPPAAAIELVEEGPTLRAIKPSLENIKKNLTAKKLELSRQIETHGDFTRLLRALNSLIDDCCSALPALPNTTLQIGSRSDAVRQGSSFATIEKQLADNEKNLNRLGLLHIQLQEDSTLTSTDTEEYAKLCRRWGDCRIRTNELQHRVKTWTQNNEKMHCEEALPHTAASRYTSSPSTTPYVMFPIPSTSTPHKRTAPGTTAPTAPQSHQPPRHAAKSGVPPSTTPQQHPHHQQSLPGTTITATTATATTSAAARSPATRPIAVVITIPDDSPATPPTPPPQPEPEPQAPQRRPHSPTPASAHRSSAASTSPPSSPHAQQE
ncbi:hypothetical protein Pelo_6501 [Pelomyxa schiedti]|nr:hypothetical protein Pelo_6501 [Pelomyxa schiedti]